MRRRRRFPVHLRLPRGKDREHTELQEGLSGVQGVQAGAQLPVDQGHRRGGQFPDFQEREPHPQGVLCRRGGRGEDTADPLLYRAGGGDPDYQRDNGQDARGKG